MEDSKALCFYSKKPISILLYKNVVILVKSIDFIVESQKSVIAKTFPSLNSEEVEEYSEKLLEKKIKKRQCFFCGSSLPKFRKYFCNAVCRNKFRKVIKNAML